jgi:hypothetical protein
VRPNDITKRFAKAMEEIENQILFDLDFFVGTLEPANAPALPLISQKPADERSDEQPEKKKTHGSEARLLRRAFVLEVLFEIVKDVLEASEIIRRRLAERLVRLQHRPGLFTFRGRAVSGRFALFG